MKSFHSFVRTFSLGLAALAVASTASAATETIFTETFSGSVLAGTTSMAATGLVASRTTAENFAANTADNAGWFGKAVYRSPYSIRLGNSKNKGWAQSPAITLTNGVATADITVTLYACKSREKANGAIVSILDASGATLESQTLANLTNVTAAADITAERNFKTLSFTDVPTGFMLRLDPAQDDGAVVLDEITVLQDIPEVSGDAPAFTAPETVTLIADKAGSFTVSALASDGVTPLEVTLASVSPTPASAQPIWDGSTLTWTPTEADVGTYDFVFQTTVSGTAYEQTVSVTVASGAPVFTAPAEVTLETGAEGAFAVQAAQADGTVCAVTLASVSPTPASAQPIWDDSTLTWTPTEADVGVYALVFETLVNGTSYQQTVSVTVEIPVPTETVFVETFSGSDLSTTSMESPELVSPSRTESGEFLSNTADHAGWIGQAVYRSHYSIRLGNDSYKGWAQSPAITLTNGVATADITVTLYACKSRKAANGAVVSILDASGATLESQTLANLTHVTTAAGITAEGNFKTLSFTDVPTGFMLRLDPAQPDGAVIFDTITVQQTLVEVSENAPTFTAPTSVEIPAGTAGSFTVTAMKTDGTAAVVTLAGISPVPAASQGTFDGTSFTWTPTVQDVGAYTVTFQSAVGAETFTHAVPVTVTVDDLAEVVPTISDVGYNHFQLDWTDAQLRTSGNVADVLLAAAVKGVGVQVAPQNHRHPRQLPVHRLQNGPHLRLPPRTMGSVLQVDGHGPQGLSAYVQLRVHRKTAADAPLPVEVPIVLLRKADHPRPSDGPPGEHGVAVEALLVALIHQLDELQAPGVVEAEGFGQLPGSVFVAGAEAAVVQLVGQDQVEGLDGRAVPEEFPDLLQVDAPLHVEHQHTQPVRDLRRGGHEVVGLRLGKLRDHGHDLRLALLVQQRAQGIPVRKRQSVHGNNTSLYI